MRLFQGLMVLLLAAVFTGCTNAPVKVSENRRIGVIALLPDKVQTKYVGIWAFSNKGEDTDVPEARFRQNATASAVDALKASGFDPVPLGLDHPEWQEKYHRYRGSLGAFFTTVTLGDVERRSLGNELKAAMAAHKLDAFALIVPGAKGEYSEANIGVGDYGFGTLTGKKDRIDVYAMTDIFILGGPQLATRSVRLMRGYKPVPGLAFREQFREYSPEEQQTLLNAMHELFRVEAHKTVKAMAR